MSLRLGLLLNQKMKQELKLTPQLQQAIRLLQLSRMELIEEVQQELMNNPLLEDSSLTDSNVKNDEGSKPDHETDDAQSSDTSDSSEQVDEIDWATYLDDDSHRAPELGVQRLHDDHDYISPETNYSVENSLQDHLMWQLQMSSLNDRERLIAIQIIGNLNDEGYLRDFQMSDILSNLNQNLHTHLTEDSSTENLVSITDEEVLDVLFEVQQFDPIGIAARDLSECLKLQADFYQLSPLVHKVIDDHLKDLERKRFTTIARSLSIPLDRVYEITQEIQGLDPRPGNKFSNEIPRYITPDVYVDYHEGVYKVRSNDDGFPRLHINSYYRGLIKDSKDTDAKQYVTQKLNAAHWMIRSLEQRKQTIVRVMECILEFQYDFFEHGSEYLKPLILKQIAEKIELHESTVSRATAGKYVYTPRGLFELKYFFNSAIQSSKQGEDLANQAVKIKIQKLIASENPKKPLSDQKIVNLLGEEGIEIARRTVAKYRESMNILSSSQRKQHF